MKETTVPTTPTTKRARRSVQSVDRALDLLEALVAAEGEVAITALATRTGLHVSTVHRLLATLLRRGYVRQNPETSRYYAGAKLATLSEGRSRFGELRLRARPLLRGLTKALPRGTTMDDVTLDEAVALLAEKGKTLKPRGAAAKRKTARGGRAGPKVAAAETPAPAKARAAPRKKAASRPAAKAARPEAKAAATPRKSAAKKKRATAKKAKPRAAE